MSKYNGSIKATFKGQDGSLGYTTGKQYDLFITHHPPTNITISRSTGDKGGLCEYQSIITFLENWDRILNDNN